MNALFSLALAIIGKVFGAVKMQSLLTHLGGWEGESTAALD